MIMLARRASSARALRGLRLSCRPLGRHQLARLIHVTPTVALTAGTPAAPEPRPEPATLPPKMGMPAELLSDTEWPSNAAVGWPRKWRYKGNPAVLVLDVKGDLVDVRKLDPLARLREQSEPPPGLLTLTAALQKAAADDQVAISWGSAALSPCTFCRPPASHQIHEHIRCICF
jgi:hypothetical protein